MKNVIIAPASSAFSPEIVDDLERTLAAATRGERDPEAMRLACERMDGRREQIFQRVGLLDVAVPAVRALRDGDE